MNLFPHLIVRNLYKFYVTCSYYDFPSEFNENLHIFWKGFKIKKYIKIDVIFYKKLINIIEIDLSAFGDEKLITN